MARRESGRGDENEQPRSRVWSSGVPASDERSEELKGGAEDSQTGNNPGVATMEFGVIHGLNEPAE